MELNFGDRPLKVAAPNVPAKLGSSSGTQTDSDQEAVNDALFKQINSLVIATARGEWECQVGGSNPAAGKMITNSVTWADVTFIWLSEEDIGGFSHDFSFLSPGDRIKIVEDDSYGTYRVVSYDDTKPGGYVTVQPMLTALAGEISPGDVASVLIEDMDGSGGGLVPPVTWGDLVGKP